MTKSQKTEVVLDTVRQMRNNFTFAEYADMVVLIWTALDAAQTKAVSADEDAQQIGIPL